MIPAKPFDSYKWRWLSVTPSEGLIDPPVFLGVLRALWKFEHKSPSDSGLLQELSIVQNETRTQVDLVRTADRNLIRNSGQYWKGTGLLKSTRGVIELTVLGKKVASGQITQGEFAAIMIQQTILPNCYTYEDDEIKKWDIARLKIKPLELIIKVIDQLGIKHGKEQAFITSNELMKIIIPLAGAKATIDRCVQALHDHREGRLDISTWPDCTPAANDERMAREFLLFLEHYGLCSVEEDKYFLSELFEEKSIHTETDRNIFIDEDAANDVISAARASGLPAIIERQRTIASIISRPSQAKFRKDVLDAYLDACLLTGEKIPETLEAAHIIPVRSGGDDNVANGFCLRVDIHRLFDSGNIKVLSDGHVLYSESVSHSNNYNQLPQKINLPIFVSQANLDWRHKYC